MFDNQTRPREHRLADLQERADYHERELAEARLSLDQELTERFYQEELLPEADRASSDVDRRPAGALGRLPDVEPRLLDMIIAGG